MAILHRTIYLAFSLVLATASVACGDDDGSSGDNGDTGDNGDNGDSPDAGGDGDGDGDGDGGEDAAPPDAPGGGVFDISGEHLLSILPDSPVISNPIRVIATVDFTAEGRGGTANVTLQTIKFNDCDPAGNGGEPVGDPVTLNDVAVNADGTFALNLVQVTIDAQAVPDLCIEVTADIDVAAEIQSEDFVCGTVDIDFAGGILGTFGTVRIRPGTTGDENLPEPVVECPGGDRADAGPA